MQSDWLQHLPFQIAALIPALTFHEWGHAAMAYRAGDMTPMQQGRLTLNPLAHLDVIGTIAIFIIGFGWAKPVPINPNNFRKHFDEVKVALAGITMNIILAVAFAMLIRVNAHYALGQENAAILYKFFQWSMMLNLFLCFFNLIPLGPLDGSHVVNYFLPLRQRISFGLWNAQYGGMILLGLIILGQFTNIKILQFLVAVPSMAVANLLLPL